ncbi:MAG: lytic transglycosylase domain-containing protein [Verrucomicrobiae bacterium]|nr:lytic transglycosylase domain-containing protein [Verrucomicrobiae bacterium]
MKPHFLLAMALLIFGTVQAQEWELDTNALREWLVAADEWAQENLNEDLLQALPQVDRERVEQFLRNLQQQLQGEYVLDVALLKDAANGLLPLLQLHEETQPYAAWLKSRLDYFDVAEELRRAAPPPKHIPDQPPRPLPNPPPEAGRRVWQKTVAPRPMPKGAEALVKQLKPVFISEQVPPELVWLAEVESSFDPRARSPVGAAGLFQIMPATAKRFGLRRWPWDQRYQAQPSAQAAARYLRILHRQFGDWRLAVAAYNAGEGRVQRLLDKHQTRSFDRIAPHLPAETQMYVPKVEATLLRREGVELAKLRAPAR